MKKIASIIVCMLVCLSSMILPGGFKVKATAAQKLYVGGEGEGNYTTIQGAINDANDGDTVFVYDNSYYENIVVNVSINLTGEDTDSTVIDGNGNGTAVTITADWVNLSGFTIQNGGDGDNDAGVKVESNYTNISGNIIKDCDAQGLFLEGADHNTIFNNTFTNITNTSTIFLWNSSSYNTIAKNNITNCGCAIDLGNGPCYNNISDNSIVNNTYGIYLWVNTTSNNSIFRNSIIDTTFDGIIIDEAVGNEIFENVFERNDIGLSIFGINSSVNNTIYHNNFINNTEHIVDECNQTWDNGYPSGGNYWDDYIYGDIFSGPSQNTTGSDGIGDEPYYELDNYPLMLPWGEYTPVAEFTYSVTNKTTSLNASDSYDRDGTIVKYEWDFGDDTNGTGETVNHTYSQNGTYEVVLTVLDNEGKNDTFADHVFVGNDITSPEITNVSNTPATVGFGFNVTISADVIDDLSGVQTVEVNVTYPDDSSMNYPMNDINGSIYEYVFSSTWQNGQYDYTIWAVDYAGNSNSSSLYSFNVSAQINVSVYTIKDSFSDNELINITDPPDGGGNGDGSSQPPVGYELLDDNQVLHIWNRYDSYYFNTSSGIQITNHYDEYWSHNVLMLGYYNNDVWNLIYRNDELSGFNKDVDTDNESYVNATLWKDLTYKGYDFRLAIRYHLGVDDNELTVIPYIKNLGEAIPYTLGFGWEMKDIQIDMTSSGDYIDVNRTVYYLNQTLDNTYTELLEPEFYLMENISGTITKSLYLRWNQSLTYKLQVKSRTGQYNAPVTLFVRIGTLDVGQEKHTKMYWYDAEQATYYFNRYDNNEAWATNPSYMVDGNPSNAASTTIDGDIELCNGNNCSGNDLGTISKVELRVAAFYNDDYRDTILRPVFGGTTDGTNYRYQTPPCTGPAWSPWFDITYDPFAPQTWSWSDIVNLDCDVEAGYGMLAFTLYCSQVEIRVTYTPYYPPEISDPYPADGSIGVSIYPVLNITVSDANEDRMNITWLSNSSNSWQVFGTNNSVGNGVYHQTFSNASENYTWYYWKVNVTDGVFYNESSVFKFYTGNCESKIKNTGSTNISGYLLMQIHFYNPTSQNWVVDHDTVDETTPRVINSSEQLGLDTIFNGLVNTWDLSYESGTYRVYVALRDPDGNVLQNDDSTFMSASFNFSVSLDMDSDADGWSDYEEINYYYTDPQKPDTDGDGVYDKDDVDPLFDLKVNFTSKRIYASEYTYTWREGESWDWSNTNTSDEELNNTEWIFDSNSSASNGSYTRQNDNRSGLNDIAMWNFTVKKAGVYYIWMRSHRYEYSSSNVRLLWNNESFFEKKDDWETHWYQDTTDEWKWSWYGLVNMSVGAGTLKIKNLKEPPMPGGYDIPGEPEFWMEVDNILITDDPHCHPNGKGVEGSEDYTIGTDLNSSWDPGPSGSDPDFYLKVTIGDIEETSNVWTDDPNVLEDWSAVVDVPDDEENVSITIELWEYDGPGDAPCDLLCDISSTGKKCNIIYNLRNATWWGDDHVLDTDFIGRTCGEVDGDYSPSLDANVIFEVSQNDKDNDGITYWQELNIYGNEDSFHPNVTNDRYAVIVGTGASCKVHQTKDIGSTQSPYKGPYLLYEKGSSWTNYTFEVDLMTKEFCDPDDKEDIGILFRYQDDDNYYILRWEQNGMRDHMYLDRVEDGVRYKLGKKFTFLTRTNWYTLSVVLNGSNIQIWKNNNLLNKWWKIFDVTDDTFSNGGIALFCWKNKQAWFDDVLVVDRDNDDVLLQYSFDYGEHSEWTAKDPENQSSEWKVTEYYDQQENFYLTLDFVYRILRNVAHYDKDNIRYLSSDK